MHKWISIIFLALTACTLKEQHKLRHELTDDEVYAVINNLYTIYLDTVNRSREIYCHIAILEDSSLIRSQVENLEGDYKIALQPVEVSTPSPITFYSEMNPWNSAKLPTFKLISEEEGDSLVDLRLQHQNWYRDSCIFYAITRPYRPSSSMRIVMQEYKINVTPNCFPSRNRTNILFTKGKNGWYLEHFYVD